MTNVIQFKPKQKEVQSKPVHRYSPKQDVISDEERVLDERIQRIKHNIQKINTLMSELRNIKVY